MAKIDNYIGFVKEQVTVQERLARKYDEDNYRKSLHFKAARTFADMGRFLEEIQRRGTHDTAYLNRGDTPQKRILITFEEVENAPEELLKELNLTENDRQELLIEYLIAQAGGVLSLDKIIVELYERTKEIPKRAALTTRLFRMANRGMIYNVPGKKGVYSTYELSEADAKKMFGQFDGEVEETASSSAASPEPPKGGSNPPLRPNRLKSQFLSGAATTTFRQPT
jgi:hypothetical protein